MTNAVNQNEAKSNLIEAMKIMEVGDERLVRGMTKATVIATVSAHELPLDKRFITRTAKGGFLVSRCA